MKYQVIFFGSFQYYSVQVLDALQKSENFQLIAAVTTPPAPKGRHLILTPTEVQTYSVTHNIPVHCPSSLQTSTLNISRPDFIVVAGYGKLLPKPWLDLPKIMAVNMHPSLLPKYSGRCPAEWALLSGEIETGVTLIRMTDKFDTGPILAQEKLVIAPDDTRLSLYHKLFTLGADLLVETLPQIASGQITPHPQPGYPQPSSGNSPYARQITRQDGFIPWAELISPNFALRREIQFKFRAFAGWPGLWSLDPTGLRIAITTLQPEIHIRPENRKPLPLRRYLRL